MNALNVGDKLVGGQYEYTIERELVGRGLFTISYVAKRAKRNCPESANYERWVLKVFVPQVTGWQPEERIYERNRQETLFMQEAAKLAKCRESPHIAKVDNPFKFGDKVCLPVEYLEGNSLGERSESQLVEQTALEYIRQIGEALKVVHREGLVHRDICPANIYLRIRNSTVQAVLTNFELAVESNTELSRTRRSELADGFSPYELYASGRSIGPSTDIYGLSATLYDLLTGKPPLSVKKRLENPEVLSPQVLNPDISGRTTKAILQGLELNPEKRPQSMESWLALLDFKVQNSQANQTRELTTDWNKWQAIWAGVAALATLSVGIPAWFSSQESSEEKSKETQTEVHAPDKTSE